MSKNKKHTINWNNRTFLEVEKNWKLRRLKESLVHQQFKSLKWNWCLQADEPRKRNGNCRLLERVSSDGQSYIKEGHSQKSTKTSEKSKPEESQRAIKRKMTHVICYISQPLCLKYLYLHCFEFLVAKRKYYCRWKQSRERRGPRIAPVEAVSRTAKYRVY